MTTHSHPVASIRPDPTVDGRDLRWALAGTAVLWIALYALNERIWDPILGGIIGLDLDSALGDAIHFFLYDSVKIMLLLTGLIFAIGLLRASFSAERARSYKARRFSPVFLSRPATARAIRG